MTLNNFILRVFGPLHERTLVLILLSIQVCLLYYLLIFSSSIQAPVHSGVSENKNVDRLAVGTGRAMDQTDILNTLSETDRLNDES